MTGQFFAPFLSALVIFSFRLSASILMLHLKTVFRAHGFYGGERLLTVTNSTEGSSVVAFVLVYVLVLGSTGGVVLVCTWRCHQWWQITMLCLFFLDVHKGVVSAGDASGDNVVLLAVLN